MKEIWKDIDERYSVSNLGRVKSRYAGKERILKPFKDTRGYLKIDLRSNGERRTVFVHRLVATQFIANPNDLPEINHIDENKENNSASNLEWCTTQYNCAYGTRNERKAKACKKKICSFDVDGNVEYFDSVREAGATNNILPCSISKALSGKFQNNKTAAGKRWAYAI